MRWNLQRWAVAAVLGVTAVAVRAEEGADSRYYQTRGGLTGYLADELVTEFMPLPDNASDQRHVYRMARHRFDTVTAEEATRIVKDYKKQGINLIISENNRYLMSEYGTTPGGNTTLHSEKTLDSIIENTNRMIAACHAEGILFIHHITATMVDSAIFEEHPDWAAILLDSGETLQNHYGTGNSCINNEEYMQAFYRALERLLTECPDADGIMVDEIQFFGDTLCGCAGCRKQFAADTGMELPSVAEYRAEFGQGQANPVFYRWLDWRTEKIAEHHRKIRELIKKNNPDSNYFLYLCNNSSDWPFFHTGLEISKFLPYADAAGLECEPPRFDYQAYWPLVIYELKYLRGIAEHNDDTPWVLYYSTKPFDQTFGWMIGFSQGTKTWFSWSAPEEYEVLANWEAARQNILGKFRTAAKIGLSFSPDSRDHNPRYAVEWKRTNSGVANALSFGQTPYRIVSPLDFETADELLAEVDTLCLFDETVITQQRAEVLRDFVEKGGTLISGGMAGTADLNWQTRDNFLLEDLYGFALDSDGWPAETLEVDLEDLRRDRDKTTLDYQSQFVKVKNVAPDVQTFGAFIHDGESCPAIYTRKVGRGEVIYFAGHLGDQYFYDTHSGENPLLPGQKWTDLRKPHYQTFINKLVAMNQHKPAVKQENLPPGILLEVFDHDFAGIRGKVVTLLNLQGMQFQSGLLPAWKYHFPSIHLASPIRLSVPLENVRKVYLLSPDYPATVELPLYYDADGYATTEISRLDRLAAIYFCQEGEAAFTQLPGGIVHEIPEAKKLASNIHPALAAPYEPDAVTVFADTDAFSGGTVISAGLKEEPARVIYGADSDCAEMKISITLDRDIEHPVLELGGMDDNLKDTRSEYLITLGGKEIYRGTSTFPDDEWKVESCELPMDRLSPGTYEIVIQMTAPGVRGGKPWLAIAFARLKEKEGE